MPAPRDRRRQPHDEEPRWMRLLEPLRSEDAAFRLLLWVAGAFAVVIAIVLIVQAIV